MVADDPPSTVQCVASRTGRELVLGGIHGIFATDPAPFLPSLGRLGDLAFVSRPTLSTRNGSRRAIRSLPCMFAARPTRAARRRGCNSLEARNPAPRGHRLHRHQTRHRLYVLAPRALCKAVRKGPIRTQPPTGPSETPLQKALPLSASTGTVDITVEGQWMRISRPRH